VRSAPATVKLQKCLFHSGFSHSRNSIYPAVSSNDNQSGNHVARFAAAASRAMTAVSPSGPVTDCPHFEYDFALKRERIFGETHLTSIEAATFGAARSLPILTSCNEHR
jgi:hypothetical protein